MAQRKDVPLKVTKGLLDGISTYPPNRKYAITIAKRVVEAAKRYKARHARRGIRVPNREGIEHGMALKSSWRGHRNMW